MAFTYLFGIAVLGIGILLFIEHKKTHSNLLQIIQRSCTIDSVRFEKNVDYIQNFSMKIKESVYNTTRKSFKKVITLIQIPFKKLKYFIRKRFHSDTNIETPSEFISKISSK